MEDAIAMSFDIAAFPACSCGLVSKDEVLDVFIADGSGRGEGLAIFTNRVWIDFTSQLNDFPSWCPRILVEFFSDSGVAALLEGIDHVSPVSLLCHRQVLGHGS
jgi:hypothetical protein